VRSVLLAGAACLAVLPSALWAQVVPVGPEFQVNAYTTGGQGSAAVATDAHGNFVVVWSEYAGVFGRRFTAAGVPRGGDFLVRSYTAGPSWPAVASSANGSFVVVYNSVQDGSDSGVFGQRFDASGAPAGGEFAVNTYTTGKQMRPAVASDATGNFVVVWQSADQDGNGYGVFGKRFDASGAALGDEFLVHSATMGIFGIQSDAAVDADASGNFIVVWTHRNAFFGGGSEQRIAAQRFDSTGALEGTEFFVDQSTVGYQGGARVARTAAGNFLVTWSRSSGIPIPSGDVLGRFFDATAAPLGPEFEVSASTVGSQGGASVDADRSGNFVVVWQSRGQEGPQFETGVFSQRFDAAGATLESEFIVNSYTTGNQRSPAVVSSPDENFVVVWQSNQGGDDNVFGQRFGDLIFRDGFESGALTRWSSSSTDGGDLSVSGAAALVGTTAGLQAFVDDTNALFVQDDTPTSENQYRARFYFDPNGFDPGEASAHFRTRLFIAFDGFNRRAFTLVLRRKNGEYAVMARVRLDDGTRANTAFVPITDDAHIIEFVWRRSSAPGANDGVFAMRIDDTPAQLMLLDNDDGAVERVRMGALTVKTGAAGTLFYDQFVSRRQHQIGPE
jgi:hypothetical protein